jgi:hypothetical protein
MEIHKENQGPSLIFPNRIHCLNWEENTDIPPVHRELPVSRSCSCLCIMGDAHNILEVPILHNGHGFCILVVVCFPVALELTRGILRLVVK